MGRVSDTQRRPAPAASCSSPTHSSRCRPSDREQLGKAFQKVVADINDDKLALDANGGCYSLLLAAARPATLEPGVTYLELPPNAATVVSRHYFEAEGSGGELVHAQLNPTTRASIVLDIAKLTPVDSSAEVSHLAKVRVWSFSEKTD